MTLFLFSIVLDWPERWVLEDTCALNTNSLLLMDLPPDLLKSPAGNIVAAGPRLVSRLLVSLPTVSLARHRNGHLPKDMFS